MCSNYDYAAIPARIWDRLQPTDDGCLIWPGATGGSASHPYGVAFFRGKSRLIHREMYEQVVGHVTSGEHVHHECGQTLCVNPLHLRALPIAEHIGQWHRDKTHCPHGHVYDEANTRLRRSDNSRHCRTCARLKARAKRAREAARAFA